MKSILDSMIDKTTGFDKYQALEQIKQMMEDEKYCIKLDFRDEENNAWNEDPNSGLMDFVWCGIADLNNSQDKLACVVHVSKIYFTKWRNKIEVDGLPYIESLGLYYYPMIEPIQAKMGIKPTQYLFIKADEVIK